MVIGDNVVFTMKTLVNKDELPTTVTFDGTIEQEIDPGYYKIKYKHNGIYRYVNRHAKNLKEITDELK